MVLVPSRLWRSHSATPDINILGTSSKSVKCPCDEPLAHLTRNFAIGNKLPSESFLAKMPSGISHPLEVLVCTPLFYTFRVRG